MFDPGLVDEQQKVRTITALAIAALAEAATPYGIESFDSVLKPLWKGIRTHRGKVRYLKCRNIYITILKILFLYFRLLLFVIALRPWREVLCLLLYLPPLTSSLYQLTQSVCCTEAVDGSMERR